MLKSDKLFVNLVLSSQAASGLEITGSCLKASMSNGRIANGEHYTLAHPQGGEFEVYVSDIIGKA